MAQSGAPSLRRHALRAWRISHRVGLHEAVVVVCAFLIYFLVRGMVVDRASLAYGNARDVIDFERDLGLYHELTIQSWILGHYALVRAVNAIYFWGHMPLVIAFAVWLFVRHRHTYGLVRNAFLASGAIAVVIYALYPVAPPRLLPGEGFIDTIAVHDQLSYNAQETGAFVNPFAAVPSLHFGWSLLLGLAVAVEARHWLLRAAGIAWPVVMFFSVVMTGNHFIVDAVAGGIVSFAGLGVAWLLSLWLRRDPPIARRLRRALGYDALEPGH